MANKTPENDNKNYSYFTSHLKEFLNDPKLKDKFLVICDEQIKGNFDTFETALKFAVSNCKPAEFIIQQAIDESQRINFIFSGR